MPIHSKLKITLNSLLLCLAGLSAFTSAQATSENAESSGVAGWSEYIATLQTLPEEMLARLPEAVRNDPQVQQEVVRVALEAMASSAVTVLGADARNPEFLPSVGRVFNVGQPNADTIYRSAAVDPAGTYRLSGRKGSTRMVEISQSTPSKKETGTARVFDHNLNDVPANEQGVVEVIMSAKRPEGYEGAWWELQPQTRSLFMRVVSADWEDEVEPNIVIERLDASAPFSRVSAETMEQRLRALPNMTGFIAKLFIDKVYKLREAGYINTLKTADFSGIGGLDSQFYYEGVYDLKDNEALLIESTVPEQCVYRSLILTNHLYETTDWYNFHSSLNDTQAKPDADGMLRIVVSERDPGVPNWLDTAGYPMGVVQGRWTGCSDQPVPSVTKVEVDKLRELLPAETPTVTAEQRKAMVSGRRAALQRRSKW